LTSKYLHSDLAWQALTLPLLTNLAKDLTSQLAKADTIPGYLSDVVTSIALLSEHRAFCFSFGLSPQPN